MTRPEIDALLERHRDAFASGAPDAIAADHAEAGTFYSPAVGTVTGRARIAGVYQYWLTAFPDMEFTWGPPIVEGDRVALFWRFRGTVSGPFFGEVKIGTKVEFPGAAEYIVSPEGIVSARHVFDFSGVLVAAGVLKLKPA